MPEFHNDDPISTSIGTTNLLRRLAEASVKIAAANDPNATLQAIADQARVMIGAHLAATHNTATADYPAVGVAISLSQKYQHFAGFKEAPTGAGIYSRSLAAQSSLRFSATALKSQPDWRNFSGHEDKHPPLRGLIAAPLKGRTGATIGVVMVSDKEKGDFTAEDELVLTQLAQIAAISIENSLSIDALKKSETRLRATREHAGVAIGECDRSGRFISVNNAFSLLTGFSTEELLKKTIYDITVLDDALAERPLFDAHVAGLKPTYSFEKRYIRKDGSVIWVCVSASAVFEHEAFSYGVRIVQDIDERKQSEARQQLLMRELHHRIKNTLALVQALAGSTLRVARNMQEFQSSFADRLVALGKTHSLLTENVWGGVDLKDLIKLELDAYDDGSRIKLQGPPVQLPAQMAVALGMALHELTTNSVKYGSLSEVGGCVAVDWKIEEDIPSTITICWHERNGPPVTPPTSKGFGSQLLQQGLAPQLNGKVEMNFAEDGLRVLIQAQLASPDIVGTLEKTTIVQTRANH